MRPQAAAAPFDDGRSPDLVLARAYCEPAREGVPLSPCKKCVSVRSTFHNPLDARAWRNYNLPNVYIVQNFLKVANKEAAG
jgi:hypothetical protein